MAKNLLAKLAEVQHLTPDEIVAKISKPIWVKGSTITQDFYNANRNREVYLYQFDAYAPDDNFMSYPTTYTLAQWTLGEWQSEEKDSIGDYWFVFVEECDDEPDPPTR